MVDYDSAVKAVQDPNADPVFLARIAYENPDFGANVAAHERAYPGLLRWIAEFGDDRAKAEAASRGYTASGGPVVPRAEEPNAVNEANHVGKHAPDSTPNGAQSQSNVAVGDADAPHGVEQALQVAAVVPVLQSPQSTPVQAVPAAAQPVVSAQPGTISQPAATSMQSIPVIPIQQSLSMQPEQPQHAVAPLIPEHQIHERQIPEHHQTVPNPQTVDGQTVSRQETNRQPVDDEHGNPYGFTVEQALDPNTDVLTIAQIAQYAPELRVYLARNPSTYPELLDWLARQHDPQIDAALAERNAVQA
ncbi:hypothetical protein JS532_03090 [Bifidobacterium callimiconis]|uniref:variant leucine-rich repeat-containing protein n=1 Tax=Bifidobacterium callimiconis TaxID=2306973 RepID=UPI001BDD27CB|nr:hypothetical protein [Bifidobacterium callimiconis]MBT1176551.1 hypothetical protein [Bifidobacterium callimiconis]